MIKKLYIVIFLFVLILLLLFIQSISYPSVIKRQVNFAPNNISTWIWNTGIFNQDLRTNNTPGFNWPNGSHTFAIFTSGLSIGAYVNGELRLCTGSYNGEYCPGYVGDSNGIPVFRTDSRFRLYSVKTGDSPLNNPDVVAWKDMVPFGAPYDDVNQNKKYDVGIDRPGVIDASQTIFFCYTDADPTNHTSSEGFSGGTKPLYSEIHLTAWGYSDAPVQDFQFMRFTIINKNNAVWSRAYFGFYTDADLGNPSDDYVGSDTINQMVYCYNGTNQDGTGTGNSYGTSPPAVAQMLLRSPIRNNGYVKDTLKMISGVKPGKHISTCDHETSYPPQAYNYLKGYKADSSQWLNPLTSPFMPTKFCFTGNPEDSTGWTEKKGLVMNCNNFIIDTIVPSPPGDVRMLLTSGADNLYIQPNDTQKIVLGQLIAGGNSNLNSVTKLKELASIARIVYYSIESETEQPYIEPPEVPTHYKLFQNYPNPFNPVTKIKYEMKKLWHVKIQVYDAKGELISTLVNEEKPQGSYEIQFDASNLPSGIYFIKMVSGGGFEDSKKMVVLK